jgi:predicted nucleic acid-binding protein
VLDTSILVQSVIIDTESRHVEMILSSLDQPDSLALHIPEFSLIECANVIWKRVRFFNATEHDALQEVRSLLTLPQTIHASGLLLPRALEIALSSTWAVYDCVHIALAETLRYPLITVDQRQAQAAEGIGVTLKSITDFPEYQED